MSAVLLPSPKLHSPQDLADFLQQVETWCMVEKVTTDYSQWKVDAWNLLPEPQQERLITLQKWKDHPVAEQFPLGVQVRRMDDPDGLAGEVVDYWQAYGVEYVTFMVGKDVDWCRASWLERADQLEVMAA
ncbi:MAG: hypothetical protein AAGG51_06240 [Cyanobacteria bacterium P01_G01_bin.54]